MSASAEKRSSSPLLIKREEELKTFVRIIAKDFPKLADFCREHEIGCGCDIEFTEEAGGFVRLSYRMCGNYVRFREAV